MVASLDSSIGIGVETTYKTGVTPTRWFEFDGTGGLDWDKSIQQGKGVRSGSRAARSGRRVVSSAMGSGDITVECVSKGMGLFWQLLMGAGTSTLVSGATYQQVFTFADNPSSVTLQEGLPHVNSDGTFTIDAYTWLGVMCESFEIDFPNDDLVTVKASLNAADLATATAYTAPSYPTSPMNLFNFAGGTVSSGTFTAPTSSALASGTTTLANIRGGSVSVNKNINKRLNMNGTGREVKPTGGLPEITGKLDVEYTDTTFRDAVIADSPLTLILTWVTSGALSTGFETLQIAIPEMKFDSELPKPNGTDLIVPSMSFAGLDNLTAAQPIWIATRTADTAL